MTSGQVTGKFQTINFCLPRNLYWVNGNCFPSPAYEQTLTADLARLLVSFSNVCLIVELLFIKKYTDNQSNLQKKLLCLILCQKSCYFTTSNMSNHHFAERKCQVLRKTFHLFLLCFKVLLVFQLAYFLTEIRQDMFLKLFGDILGMLVHQFQIIFDFFVCLLVCQVAYFLTEI